MNIHAARTPSDSYGSLTVGPDRARWDLRETSESDVYRRQILTSDVDSCAARVKCLNYLILADLEQKHV